MTRWSPGFHAAWYESSFTKMSAVDYAFDSDALAVQVVCTTTQAQRGDKLYIRFTEDEVRRMLKTLDDYRRHRMEEEYGPYVAPGEAP